MTAQRFRGASATQRSQEVAGATAVAVIVALGWVGLLGPAAIVLFFAVGAGAGYSLSGSV